MASGTAELTIEALGEIRVKRGNVRVVVDAECDRCLEPTQIPIDFGV